MAFARAIASAYERAGRDPSPAIALAQITPKELVRPDGRMSARQMALLSAAAMRELDDEGLGALGRRLPWGSYGMLARASLGAPDLGTALKRWCRHHGLLTDSIALEFAIGPDAASVAIEERATPYRADLSAGLRELSLVFILRNIHGLACWFIDSRIPLQAAQFPFPAPRHAEAYRHMFQGCTSVFEAARAEIRFDARYLALPLRRDEKALSQMLRQQSLNIPVLPYRRDRLLAQQVRQLLRAGSGPTPDAQQLAARLNLSVRSLHRHLKDEGVRLQQLKDGTRREHALELLHRGNRPLKQIAAEVGFRSEKSFMRAFRQWTGASPGEFRRGARD